MWRKMKLSKVGMQINKWGLAVLLMACLGACSTEHSRLLKKADAEAQQQKSQLAKHLYLRIIEKHEARDNIRYRALKGLATVSLTQLFDYRIGLTALNHIFDEYGKVERYQSEIYELRLMAAKTWRVNMEMPEKALDVLSPVMQQVEFTPKLGMELGEIYLAMGDYEQAQHWLFQAWQVSRQRKDCDIIGRAVMGLVQVHSLQNLCKEAISWANTDMPQGCELDRFSLRIEEAHCLEMLGQTEKAFDVYEQIIKEDPKNERAHFFLDSLKRRQKEKQQK